MTSNPTSTISGLSEGACGVVLTLALAPAHDDAGRLAAAAAVGGPEGASCRAALTALASLPRAQRARVVAGLVQRVTASVPAGIAQVHPSWLRAALEGEATEVLGALTDGLPAPVREVAREIIAGRAEQLPVSFHPGEGEVGEDPERSAAWSDLRRAIFSALVNMPEAPPTAGSGGADPAEWQRLALLPASALLEQLARDGSDLLGVSLAGAPPAVVARAAARAGAGALGDVVVAGSRRPSDAAERAHARALVTAAAVAGAAELALPPTQAIGLLALAQRLISEPPEAMHAVAQRLPIAIGRVLLDQHACPI
jgi:hypothetical protein